MPKLIMALTIRHILGWKFVSNMSKETNQIYSIGIMDIYFSIMFMPAEIGTGIETYGM